MDHRQVQADLQAVVHHAVAALGLHGRRPEEFVGVRRSPVIGWVFRGHVEPESSWIASEAMSTETWKKHIAFDYCVVRSSWPEQLP